MAFNVSDIYNRVFSFVGPPFPASRYDPAEILPVRNPNLLFGNSHCEGVRMPVKITIPGEEPFYLPNEPIISLDNRKDAVISHLNRGIDENGNIKKGTVKEEVDLGDYKILIRGIVFNEEERDFPESELTNIRKMYEYSGNIGISCPILDVYNIKKIYLIRKNLSRVPEDSINMQKYVMEALSDEDFELEVSQNKRR